MVEVTQEDREAAANYLAVTGGTTWGLEYIRDGMDDDSFPVQAFARHRIAAENAAQQEITTLRARIAEDQAQIVALTTYKENLRDEVVELRARIAELEARLEIDPAYPYDGIAARDATIEGIQGQIAELEAERAQWVEVERLRMEKGVQ